MRGGLSRNKVAVGESAAGSPPNEIDFLGYAVAKQTVKLPVSTRKGFIAKMDANEREGSNPSGAGLDAPRDVNHEGRAESQTNDFSRPCKGLHTGR